MYGYTEDEFLRLSLTDLDTPEHAAKAPSVSGVSLKGKRCGLRSHIKKGRKRLPC